MAVIKDLKTYNSVLEAVEELQEIKEEAIVPWTVSDLIIVGNSKDLHYLNKLANRRSRSQEDFGGVPTYANTEEFTDNDLKSVRVSAFYPGCVSVGIHDDIQHYDSKEQEVIETITTFIKSLVDSNVSVSYDPGMMQWYCNKELVAAYALVMKDGYKFSGPTFYVLDPSRTNITHYGDESPSLAWKKAPICTLKRSNNAFINKFTTLQYSLEEFTQLICPVLEDVIFS